jgi:serine/threonine-protein kinase
MSTCPTCGTKYGPNVHLCSRDGAVLEEDASPEQQQVGKVLAGKYRLDAALSHGGMGVVYRATHVMLNKPVAVKLIKSDLAVSAEVARRFQREARAASNLNHPNIVAVYDLGQTEDGTLYIAMELVDGPSLKDVIKGGGPMEASRTCRILGPVANALSLAHRHGIIHRDLKPQNIMLADGGGGAEVPKLLDFGIAKTFDETTAQLTATGSALGTPQYMSPEQALGKPVDERADLYSLGIILYEMLVGEVPFSDQSTAAILVKQVSELPVRPSVRRPEVSPALEAIALRCMEKDPANRFQSADEVFTALNAAGAADGAAGVAADPPAGGARAGSAWDATLPAAVATAGLSQAPQGGGAATPAAGPQTVQLTAQQPAPTPQQAPTIPAPAPTAVQGGVAPPAPATATHPTVSMPAEAKPAAAPVAPVVVAAPGGAKSSRGARPLILLGVAVLVLISVAAAAWQLGYLPPGARRSAQAPVAGMPANAAAAPSTVAGTQADHPGEPSATPATGAPGTTAGANPPAATGEQAGRPAEQPAPAGDSAARLAEPPARSAEPPPTTPLVKGPRQPAGGDTAAARPAAAKAAPAAATRAPGAGAAAVGRGAPAAPGAATALVPQNPSVFVRCSGAPEICSAARTTFAQALQRDGMTTSSSPASADVVVEATATIVDERSEEQFGTTFVVRTYSLAVDANATRFRESIPMPEPRTFSFDARYGPQRATENTRVVANSAIESVREYWKKKGSVP